MPLAAVVPHADRRSSRSNYYHHIESYVLLQYELPLAAVLNVPP